MCNPSGERRSSHVFPELTERARQYRDFPKAIIRRSDNQELRAVREPSCWFDITRGRSQDTCLSCLDHTQDQPTCRFVVSQVLAIGRDEPCSNESFRRACRKLSQFQAAFGRLNSQACTTSDIREIERQLSRGRLPPAATNSPASGIIKNSRKSG